MALHWAIQSGKLELVRSLIERFHADVNAEHRGKSPIFLAIEHRSKDIVALLLSQEKINFQTHDRGGITPLLYAASRGSSSTVQALINKHHAELNAQDKKGQNVLWYTVYHGLRKATQKICQAGGNMNMYDQDRLSPLHLAIEKIDICMVKILLDHCKNTLQTPAFRVGVHRDFDQSSLVLASGIGAGDIVWLLLKYGVRPDTRNTIGESSLHVAAAHGHDLVAKLLLDSRDIDRNMRDVVYHHPPLHYAAMNGHLSLVELLLNEQSIDINARDTMGATALWWATQKQHNHVAKRLLAECNVDVNATGCSPDYYCTTSLYHAVEHDDEMLVRLLLKQKNINPNISIVDGSTPLVRGAQKGNVNIVRLLLKQKYIHVNATGPRNETPLVLAAGAGHTEVVKELLAHPRLSVVKPYETWFGDSALLSASRQGHADIVGLFLQDSRVQPNCEDQNGVTALWWAAYNGHMEVIRCLIQSS